MHVAHKTLKKILIIQVSARYAEQVVKTRVQLISFSLSLAHCLSEMLDREIVADIYQNHTSNSIHRYYVTVNKSISMIKKHTDNCSSCRIVKYILKSVVKS